MIDFNTEPYNDDFDENNKFYRILFRPSFAVQARELTQMQSILQNQIKRHGDHIFKQGAMVIPGQASIDCNTPYVKLQPLYAGAVIETFVNNLEGLTIVGQTTGVRAQVIKVANAVGSDPATIYVRYVSSGDDAVTKTFADDEIIEPEDTAKSAYTVQAISADAIGVGSTASIERGVYYANGFFVLVDAQTITLDKYSNTPTYRIGLGVTETLVTPEDPGYEMLLDNAQNSYNYAAPGAHRYMIDLTLKAIPYDSVDDVDFIEVIRVNGGQIVRHVIKTDYSELEKTLARRTMDESGNYTVKPFKIDIREHRNNNRGAWTQNTAYLIGDVVVSNGKTYVAKNSSTSVNVAPSHTTGTAYDGPGSTGIQWEYNENPFYNRGVYDPADGGSADKLAVGLEPGKAYVQGYEIEKIATEYVAVDKARVSVQVDNAVIPATVGNYILVTNVNSLPPVHQFVTVDLYDQLTSTRGAASGTKVGTARVRFIEWDNGDKATQSAVYKLGLFDIKMLNNANFYRKVKSVVYTTPGDTNLNFTADIYPELTTLSGLATGSGTTTVTGTNSPSFQTQLAVGDYITLDGTVRRVTAIGAQNSMTVSAATTISNASIKRYGAKLYEPENSGLVFPLPYYAVKSARSSAGTNDTTYSVYERFTGTAGSGSGGFCTLTVTTSSGTFASTADNDNYIVLDNDATSGGTIVVPSNIVISGSTATITLVDTYAGRNMVVIGAVNKSGTTLTEKSKTLVSVTDTTSFTTSATTTKTELLLGHADGYRLISVKMKTGTFASPGSSYSIDITDRYTFDNGQRDSHYDVARLVLKSSYSAPTAPIEVRWEYFSHSTGDYFTVNSYPNNVAYDAIPFFNNTPLRDVIDFRPRIDDTASNFTGSGATTALVPKRGIDARMDFQYYLPRKTKVAIDFSGNFFAIDGVSALNPGEPIDPALGMVLYTLELEPYTFGTSSDHVAVKTLDNKRYTMRDIGKLEKRIDNLEYYTSLSLLEQQTDAIDVLDAQGDTRFKNGFIVDGFTGHNTGDPYNRDYLCSIDMEQGELRPFFAMQNVNLIEKNSTNSQRSSSNYQIYGDVITLPVVDHVPLVKQEYASRLENINPFAIFTFLGTVNLNPATDDWFEVDRKPDLVVEVEGNYNALKTISEKAGILGTVWNSWQTNWSGVSSRVVGTNRYESDRRWGDGGKSLDSRFGLGPDAPGWAHRIVTTQVIATSYPQSRTGVKTSLVAKIDRQVVGDRVLSTAAIPYIRSRNILVQVRGLKPSSRFYPFFDDVDMSAFCTPASKLVYTPVSGVFDTQTNVGGLSADTSRRINGDSQVCLNKGDVITGQTSNATAVVVGKEYNPDTGVYSLFVHNIKGTFSSSESIVGSITGARGTFQSVTTYSQGANLVSNFSGDLILLFNIPNTEAIRFRCGERELKLVDVPQANGDYTSRGRAMYRAQGILETRQQTVNAVRNAELVQEQVADNRVVVGTSERVVSDTGWYDPLAQTFLVQCKGGAFLSKVDIFFASKDPKIPVNLEIREVVNGYPGKLVLPFSKVSLKPEEVNLSANSVTLDAVTYPKYDTPTSFTFPSPVYVQDNAEYAIVLSSDSNNYKVWISQLGDQIPGSSRTISEQPYAGVFFKSQNASTWTADQMQDLKFTIYRAKFATNVVGDVEFVNDALPYQLLDTDPVETRTGQTKVRFYQKDHGMPSGSRVVVSDLTTEKLTGYTGTGTITTSTTTSTVTGVGTAFTTQLEVGSLIYNSAGTYIGKVSAITNNTTLTLSANAAVAVSAGAFKYRNTIQGIPSSEIYTTHVISDVDMDSYCVTVTTAATSTGYAGGTTMRATRNLQFDAVQPSVSVQNFSETTVAFGMKGTSGKSVDSSSQVAYGQDGDFFDVLANENNTFNTPKMVASDVNETYSLGGNKSLTFNVTMTSSNEALSPILDTQRTSMVVVNNKINSPSQDNMNVGGLDENTLLSANTTIGFADANPDTLYTTNATARQVLQTVTVGKYLTISGSTGGANDGTFLVSKVADDGTTTTITFANAAFTTQAAGTAITIKQREIFVDEIAPFGSSTISKYVTKRINLANASNYLRVRFAANIPSDAAVEVWYKVNSVGSSVPFEQINYAQMTSDDVVVYAANGSNEFTDMSFSLDNISSYDAVSVKLVMKSTNTSAVPRIKDLRVIACA